MADSLNSEQEEISELKPVLQEEDRASILLSTIATEMTNLTKVMQTSEESREVLPEAVGKAIRGSPHITDSGKLCSHQKLLPSIQRR